MLTAIFSLGFIGSQVTPNEAHGMGSGMDGWMGSQTLWRDRIALWKWQATPRCQTEGVQISRLVSGWWSYRWALLFSGHVCRADHHHEDASRKNILSAYCQSDPGCPLHALYFPPATPATTAAGHAA